MNRFSEFFADFMNDELPQYLGEAAITKIDIVKESRSVLIEISPPGLVHKDVLLDISKKMEKKMSLSEITIKATYDKSLFSIDYFDDILFELRRKGYPANGIFQGADKKFEDDVLTISLKRGGYDMIKATGCDEGIRRVIMNEFGTPVQVEFDGILDLDSNSKLFKDTIGTAPPPKAIERKGKMVPTESVKKRSNAMFDTGDMPIDLSSPIVVYGKDITTAPTPIKEVCPTSGTVTVWGDILRKESITSKDGRW
ncbi:MAG: PolC-type DNA polymerase III N-terminal domain-containing protein, partial [Oscillospiraceae bacterium]